MNVEFNKDIIEKSNDTIVIVDFYANRCSPCRMLAPILDEIIKTYPRPISLVKIDCDDQESNRLASNMGVRNIPDVRIYFNGKEVSKFIGFKPKQAIEQILNSI